MPDAVHAYDLRIHPRSVGRIAEDADHGWLFGLPRGIEARQWPLDPHSGAPMAHGFTLLLPPDHRCHGPDIVGLAFFVTHMCESDWAEEPLTELGEMILSPPAAPPAEPAMRERWEIARHAHPRLHRLSDIISLHYAVILLTADELTGKPTAPPVRTGMDGEVPAWIERGAARAFIDNRIHLNETEVRPDDWDVQRLGAIPEPGLDVQYAVRWERRANDPNAGLAPVETHGDGPAPNGYVAHYWWADGEDGPASDYREHDWAADHAENHIGGTMRPTQDVPEMGPHYIEFGEHFGGSNFGADGNAQLDFQSMRFDWQCG